jgi:hypothetical protein
MEDPDLSDIVPSTETTKTQVIFWWIASIAASVLCCSVLFLLFAQYIVDIKSTMQDASARIDIIRDREDRILYEIDMLRRQGFDKPKAPVASGPEAARTLEQPRAAEANSEGIAVSGQGENASASRAAPVATGTSAPTSSSPASSAPASVAPAVAAAPNSASATPVPITPPVMPVPSAPQAEEKK